MAKNRPVVTQVIPQDKKAPAQKAPEPLVVADDGLPPGVIAAGFGDESFRAAITDDADDADDTVWKGDTAERVADGQPTSLTEAGLGDESLSAGITDDGDKPSKEQAIAESTTPRPEREEEADKPDGLKDTSITTISDGLPGDNSEPEFGFGNDRPIREDLGTPTFGLVGGERDDDAPEPGDTALGSKESLIGLDLGDVRFGVAVIKANLGLGSEEEAIILDDLVIFGSGGDAAEPPPPSPPGEPDTAPPGEPETGQSGDLDTGQSLEPTPAEKDRAQRAEEAARIQREQDAAKKAEEDAKKAEEAEKAQALEDEEAAREAEQAAAKKAEAEAATPDPQPSQPDPENEGAPLPEHLQRELDALRADLRAQQPARNPDDGATDPVEGGDDDAFGSGVGTGIPTGVLAQGKEGLIGQPPDREIGSSGSGVAGPSLGNEIQGPDLQDNPQSSGRERDLFPEEQELVEPPFSDTEDTNDTGADPVLGIAGPDFAVEDPAEQLRDASID